MLTVVLDVEGRMGSFVMGQHTTIYLCHRCSGLTDDIPFVEWGTAGGPSEDRGFVDSAHLSGLEPDTEYTYQVVAKYDGVDQLILPREPFKFRTGKVQADGDLSPANPLQLYITGLTIREISQYVTPTV